MNADRPLRVLVVEEPILSTRTPCDVLDAEDLECHYLTDPERTLPVARVWGPDVLVVYLDREMTSGLELAQKFSTDAELRPVRRIAFASSGLPLDVNAALTAGFERVVLKPRTDQLLDVIRELGEAALRPRHDRPLEPFRVLVVDRQVELAQKVVTALKSEGFTALHLKSVLAGLDSARWFQPHAIVADLSSREMTGEDFALLMRDRPTLKGIPLVGFAEAADSGTAAGVLEAGFETVVNKPHVEVLVEVLREINARR